MNKSFQFLGLDKNSLNAKNSTISHSPIIILQQAATSQLCGCCDECQCEQHVGDENFVCPCSSGDRKCCC